MVTNPQVLFFVIFVFVFAIIVIVFVIIVIANLPQNPSAPPIYPCGICHKEVAETDQVNLSNNLYLVSFLFKN